jgi:hypothetical protein
VTRTENTGARSVCVCKRNAASPEWPAREWRLRSRSRGAAAWALPSIALALVPKCPMCIAAYLAIGGSLGVSLTTATHLRTVLVWLCWSALSLLAVRMAMRFMRGSTITALKLAQK